ncbi:transient receptor potential protein isoform X2 [Phymastichus coffea]|uniref:transient receptor potential protein isoform X2 n=1 Tax=Phymastichus coffea TaxID=108790 RepID=UPI00273B4779|nr:transient receptor potential protein isoform X2 [Phymastichus coffea]
MNASESQQNLLNSEQRATSVVSLSAPAEYILGPVEKHFLLSAERGDCATVRRLLEENKDHPEILNIDCVDPLNRSALIAAIENENIDLIYLLLEMGISVKVRAEPLRVPRSPPPPPPPVFPRPLRRSRLTALRAALPATGLAAARHQGGVRGGGGGAARARGEEPQVRPTVQLGGGGPLGQQLHARHHAAGAGRPHEQLRDPEDPAGPRRHAAHAARRALRLRRVRDLQRDGLAAPLAGAHQRLPRAHLLVADRAVVARPPAHRLRAVLGAAPPEPHGAGVPLRVQRDARGRAGVRHLAAGPRAHQLRARDHAQLQPHGRGLGARRAPDPGAPQARHQVQAEAVRRAPQRAAAAGQDLVRRPAGLPSPQHGGPAGRGGQAGRPVPRLQHHLHAGARLAQGPLHEEALRQVHLPLVLLPGLPHAAGRRLAAHRVLGHRALRHGVDARGARRLEAQGARLPARPGRVRRRHLRDKYSRGRGALAVVGRPAGVHLRPVEHRRLHPERLLRDLAVHARDLVVHRHEGVLVRRGSLVPPRPLVGLRADAAVGGRLRRRDDFQISLGRMIIDIIKFFFIYTLVLFAFGCGMNQLLWYYADLEKNKCYHLPSGLPDFDNNEKACSTWRRFANLFETSQSLFWASFGMVDLMSFDLTGIKSFTRFWALLMFGSYSVINIIVLLNMLIAMMSNSYQIISERADTEWKFARSHLWMSYFEDGDTVPPPFNMIPTAKTFDRIVKCGKTGKPTRSIIKKSRDKAQERHDTVMRLLIRRYVTTEQSKTDDFGITEDDVMEIRQDISTLRYELIDILRQNGMKTPEVDKGDSSLSGKKGRVMERRLQKDFQIGPIEGIVSSVISQGEKAPKDVFSQIAKAIGRKSSETKKKDWNAMVRQNTTARDPIGSSTDALEKQHRRSMRRHLQHQAHSVLESLDPQRLVEYNPALSEVSATTRIAYAKFMLRRPQRQEPEEEAGEGGGAGEKSKRESQRVKIAEPPKAGEAPDKPSAGPARALSTASRKSLSKAVSQERDKRPAAAASVKASLEAKPSAEARAAAPSPIPEEPEAGKDAVAPSTLKKLPSKDEKAAKPQPAPVASLAGPPMETTQARGRSKATGQIVGGWI